VTLQAVQLQAAKVLTVQLLLEAERTVKLKVETVEIQRLTRTEINKIMLAMAATVVTQQA
jgi:hypothetical protein